MPNLSILKTVVLTVFLTIMQHHKFLAALPLALAVSAAWAADDGYTTLDTSVVSASGYAQDTREAPASITVIDAKELMTKPIGDIGTAVSDVPGVDITTTKMGTSQIYIRGFSSDYTLLMVDGRRQNSDSAMNSLNGFEAGGIFMPPPGAVERVEVMRGPASTIYGSDGIGGAGHGDGLTGGPARGGAHTHLNGSALGHIPHVERTVTGTRSGVHADGSRFGRPENLPPGVGDHTDRIVRRGRFVEGERCGFDGGIPLVRRVVAAARGGQQQAEGERP